ncbi:HVO_0476 family zinc finger protein [Methanolobus sp. ZRKC3]|uniref:HVO_0476 family zinc finger protein n=1 Tax=Methanolobus sp. ZRKC3 TaxID=3125786 RepID=UPI00325243CA
MNDEVEVVCPSCSPKIEVMHDVLKSGQNPVVECQECGSVHPTTIERPKVVNVKVIISKRDESFTCMNRMTSEDIVRINDELIIDDGKSDDVYPILVSSIEAGDRRPEVANATDIDTIWGRAIDEVVVKVAIHQGKSTRPLEKRVPGGYEFTVGETDTLEGTKYRITKIKIRDGSMVSRKGTVIEAKFIKRVFAEEVKVRGWGEGKTAWSMKRNERY